MTVEAEKKAREMVERVLLRNAQWSSLRYAAPLDIEGPTKVFSACPACAGVKPSAQASLYFLQSEIGHSEKCDLPAALKQQEK